MKIGSPYNTPNLEDRFNYFKGTCIQILKNVLCRKYGKLMVENCD